LQTASLQVEEERQRRQNALHEAVENDLSLGGFLDETSKDKKSFKRDIFECQW